MKPGVKILLFSPLILYFIGLPFSMAAMEAFGWLSFLLALGFVIRERVTQRQWPRLPLGPDLPLWLFWGALVVGALFIDELPREERIYIIGEGRWILLLYAMTFLLRQVSEEKLKKWVPVLVGIFAFVGLFAMGQFFFGYFVGTGKSASLSTFGGLSGYRPPGFYSSTMTYAYGIGQWCLLLIGIGLVLFRQNKWMFFGIALAVVLLAGSLLLTFTRGAWLSMTVATLVLFWVYNKKWGAMVTALGAIILPLLIFSVPALRHRVANVMDNSNSNRIMVWKANVAMFQDHPVMGVGYRQNASRLPEYKEKLGFRGSYVGHAHNTYLQILAGTGVLGFSMYMAFVFGFIWIAVRTWRLSEGQGVNGAIALGVLAAHIHLHVGGLTECNFQDGEVNHSFVFLTALLLAAYHRETKKNS